MLEHKTDRDDFEQSLLKIQQELNDKIGTKELNVHLDEQTLINEALCAENCIGRWIWKSGVAKSSGIPWEVQAVNTCPDNFIWEKGQTCVITTAPGLYEVSHNLTFRYQLDSTLRSSHE